MSSESKDASPEAGKADGKGKHKGSWLSSTNDKGEYVRKESVYRNWVKKDGSTDFAPEAGRYHLYVCYACPWAHRTLTVRALKGLEDTISVTAVHPWLRDGGWQFAEEGDADFPDSTPDALNGKAFLREVYVKSNPDHDGNVTVPVLWDKKTNTVVNNESSEIIRMLNSEFNEFCKTDAQRALDLYPTDADVRGRIDAVNEWVYPFINNGVYRCGFATSQEAYEKAYHSLFEHLEKAEELLSKHRYLAGDEFTEADVRLFTTIIRFDAVYYCHFKCNRRRIEDYPNLRGFVRDVYQMPGVAATTKLDHIKLHYFKSHKTINPFSIVPVGPDVDYTTPHGRGD